MADLIAYHVIHNLKEGITVEVAVGMVFKDLIYNKWAAQYPYNTLSYNGDENHLLSVFKMSP
jgi:hypothetical protein